MNGSPFASSGEGVRVVVRVTPRGGRDCLEGIVRDDAGRAMLKARVAAAPSEGAANSALIALLSRAWGVPKSRLHLVAGGSARTKTVLVAGDPATLLPQLTAGLAVLPA